MQDWVFHGSRAMCLSLHGDDSNTITRVPVLMEPAAICSLMQ
jgi:hypothetical protein